jgi:CRP-like cAMP-binding protein
VTDFLDEKRREINDRLAELKPLIDEYNRLEAAASALAGVAGGAPRAAASSTATRRGPGRPRGSRSRTTSRRSSSAGSAAKTATATATPRRRAGRRKGSGTRAAQALQFVTGQPGITIPELAAKMGIKQNYLYRVLPGLEQEGKISKKGRGWHPKS